MNASTVPARVSALLAAALATTLIFGGQLVLATHYVDSGDALMAARKAALPMAQNTTSSAPQHHRG